MTQKLPAWASLPIAKLLLVSLTTAPLGASVVSNSTCLPPAGAGNAYLGMFHQWTVGGVMYDLNNPIHSAFTTCTASPTVVGGMSTDVFGSMITGTLFVGGVNHGQITASANVTVNVQETSATNGGDGALNGMSMFSTQMTQLDINLGGGMLIRIDPTTPSTGQTTITCTNTPCTPGNGTFQISSFFDVFTDLSLDGGATWTPSSGPGPGGSTIMTLATIPEPGSLLLLVTGLALIIRAKPRSFLAGNR